MNRNRLQKLIQLATVQLKKIRTHRLTRSFFQLSGSTVLGQAILFLSTPVLSRIYAIESFAEYTTFLSMLAFSGVLTSFLLNTAILRAESHEVANKISGLSIWLTTGISTFCLLAIELLNCFTPHQFFLSANYWRALYFVTVFSGLFQIGEKLCNYHELYSAIASQRLIRTLINAGLSISIGFTINDKLGYSPVNGLVLAYGISTFLSAGYFWYVLFANNKLELNIHAIGDWKNTLVKNADMLLFLFPASLIDVFSKQILIWGLTHLEYKTHLGSYGFAQRIMGVPAIALGTAAKTLFTREFAKRRDSNQVSAKRFVVRTWILLAIVGSPIFLVIILTGPWLITLVFGAKWKLAGQLSQWLALVYFGHFISTPTSSVMMVTRQLHNNLVFIIVTALLRFVSGYVTLLYFGPLYAVICFSITECFVILAYNVIAWRAI